MKVETKLTAAQVAIAEAMFGTTYAVTLGKREGTPTSIAVPVADMPEAAILAMFSYGVQRKFNDAVGGSTVTLDDKVKAARQMVADYLEGKVRKARAGGASVDPVEVEIANLLRPEVKKAWIAANSKEGWKAREEDEVEADIADLFDAQSDEVKAAIRTKAEAEVERKRAAQEDKKGLASLIKM